MIEKACVLTFPKIPDTRGNLTFVESGRHLPFDFKRIFYIYDIPGNSSRAGHAHKTLQQIIIALSGCFDVELDDGIQKKTFHLDSPCQGLFIPPMIWRYLHHFSAGSVCMVLASEYYSEADYYRDYEDFIAAVKIKNS